MSQVDLAVGDDAPRAPTRRKQPPPRRTQAERREQSEHRILEAAVELVALKGAYAVTLAEIGERAGYSRGLPAHRFGNKTNLMKALAQHLSVNFSVFTDRSAPAELGRQRLEFMSEAYLFRKDKGWVGGYALIMLIAEARLIDEDLASYMVKYNREVVSYLRKNIIVAIKNGDISSCRDPSETAKFLLSVFRGAALMRIVDPEQDMTGLHQQVLIYLNS